ncbi:hypothetical protein HPC62_00115 [Thermoleptolyngbya sichuanensis A183]|uniref:Uncharacterized protein n=1 Tax=Thermoleptolyngbya sichuanensis A183 TaxID=2737172 RepID=A0A6M8B323_9CYAN|nr:hypothetical protein [Thermoleptolyngbya sichuanensis]QKD80788.1 hypothetical protein HPC62_00115 [Thermoleptolyngbya sichuanensis A183]
MNRHNLGDADEAFGLPSLGKRLDESLRNGVQRFVFSFVARRGDRPLIPNHLPFHPRFFW